MTRTRLPLALTILSGAAVGTVLAVAAPSRAGLAISIAYILGAIVLVYVTARWPECVFALFLFSSFVKPAVGGVDLTLVTAVLSSLGALLKVRTHGLRRTPPAVWLFVALAAMLLAGVVGSPSFSYGLDKALRFATLGLMTVFAVPQLLRDRPSLRRFALSLAAVGTAMSVWATWAGGDPVAYGRYTAFGSNTLALGQATAVAFACWLAAALTRQVHLSRALAGGGLCAWALIGSGNRAAFLGLLIVTVVLIGVHLLARRSSLRGLIAMVVCLVVFASLVWAYAPAGSRQRYLGLLEGARDNSTFERKLMYAAAVSLFERAPVFGIGTGGFGANTPVHWYPHNPLLELLAENGFLAGAIYAGLLVGALYLAIRDVLRTHAFESSLVLGSLLVMLPVVMASSDINGYRIFYAFMVIALTFPLSVEGPSLEGGVSTGSRGTILPAKETAA